MQQISDETAQISNMIRQYSVYNARLSSRQVGARMCNTNKIEKLIKSTQVSLRTLCSGFDSPRRKAVIKFYHLRITIIVVIIIFLTSLACDKEA